MNDSTDKYTTSDAGDHNAEWRKKIQMLEGDEDKFFGYFDTANSVREGLIQGAWDYSTHIVKPQVAQLLGAPFSATALEIGFGGGRLLAAASRHFNKVIGVDIHDSFDSVRRLLSAEGVQNFELLKGDGKKLPVPDASIDFVYSFIVFQHLPFVSVLQNYLAEIHRVLKPGSPAILYFGYLPFRRGWTYRDMQSGPIESSRENSLLLRPRYAVRLLREAGLRKVSGGRSVKKPWLRALGQQYYAIVVRP